MNSAYLLNLVRILLFSVSVFFAGFYPSDLHAQGFHISIGPTSFGPGNLPAPIRELTKSSKTKFQEAVSAGDVQRAAEYVKPEYVNELYDQYPPLAHATIHGNTRMAVMLVKNGASVSYRSHGDSLVKIAAQLGHSDTAKALLELHAGSESDLAKGHAQQVANQKKEQQSYAEGKAAFEQNLRNLGFGGSSNGKHPGTHVCPVCNGTGVAPGRPLDNCDHCGGSGRVSNYDSDDF